MKHIVDISKIKANGYVEWEDLLNDSLLHLKFTPIKSYFDLFVVENATDEDLITLTLLGFYFRKDFTTDLDTLCNENFCSSTGYLVETIDGYRIMTIYYGRVLY